MYYTCLVCINQKNSHFPTAGFLFFLLRLIFQVKECGTVSKNDFPPLGLITTMEIVV